MKKLALLLLLWTAPTFGQVTVALSPVAKQQFFSVAGAPLVSGCINTYTTGTSTPLATYTDGTGATQNSNPIILDGGGFANIWLTNASYRFVVVAYDGIPGNKCAAGITQYTVDAINAYAPISTGANLFLLGQSTDPAGTGGELIYRNDIPCIRAFTTLWDCLVTLTSTQTLTNKTLTTPTVNSPTIATATINGASTGSGIQGTDSKLLSSGTISGSTGVSLCTDANGGATTAGCASASVNTVASDGTATTVNGNTTSAQNLKSYTFGVGLLNSIGKAFRVRGSGVYVPVNNTETVQINVTIGTVNLSLGQVPAVALGTGQWYWEFSCITQTTGATGTVSCNGLMTLLDSSANFKAQNIATLAGGATVNLTVAQTIQFTVSFSTASATNTCTQDTLTVEAMN